ncbi:MAG: hypothetical protein IKL18_07340 [Oscillospiraceae bacterium]|nr:hypothetical protein [Oscillospiraceae bacterium]
MGEFIKEVLPFILIGLSLVIFAVSYIKKHKDKDSKNDWDFSSIGPILGVAVGIAVGTASESIGAALGAGIGMFAGTIIEIISENSKK